MSTYEIGAASRAILDQALTDLRAEVDRVLAGCGASAEEKERVRKAWAPVQALVRGTVTVSVPDPQDIEREYIERGHKPLRKLVIVRKPSTAECYAAAGDEPLESA